ncbi:MAG: zinc-binding protein [Firmicutes bacterium]|nr:zinc-binding protein [Bacillota bacterium]
MYQDKTLICRDCKQEFIFSAGEQEFYAQKGFANEPARCPECRAARKQRHSARRMYTVICSECGQETEVPFNPSSDRPVYCRSCFQKHR